MPGVTVCTNPTTTTLPPTTTTTVPPTTTTTAPSADPGSQAAATAAAQAWAAQAVNNCPAQNGGAASITPSRIGVTGLGIGGPGFVADRAELEISCPVWSDCGFDATFENGAWVSCC